MQITAFQHAVSQSNSPDGRKLKLQDALAMQAANLHEVWQRPAFAWPSSSVESDWIWVSVADGVSSTPYADLASRSFLQILHEEKTLLNPNQLPDRVRQTRNAWQARHRHPQIQGASTTLASLLIHGDRACAVNCGDSRIWRLRKLGDGAIGWLQLSYDHTVWQQMLDDGEVKPEQRNEYASVYQGLLHCLTLGENCDVLDRLDDDEFHPIAEQEWLHTWFGQVEPGDIYLLATDGLHETLGDQKIQSMWCTDQGVEFNLGTLKQAFLKAGAPDDCSVIAISI